jgi:hypothetical protein
MINRTWSAETIMCPIGVAERLEVTEAVLNYLDPTGERPRSYTFDPPANEPRTNIRNKGIEVPIRDARPIVGEITLDRQGFELVRHRSAVRNFYGDDEVKRVYYPEAERLLKAATGASRVFVFDHVTRRRDPDGHGEREGRRQPVTRVHVDHTASSGPQRVRDLLPDEAEELLRGRVQIVNVWRPIAGPLLDAPLAVCDAGSVETNDLVPSDLIYPHRVGETYSVTYRPSHRWFYFPKMRTDEALLLKCYDSKEDGRARFAPHTAFMDPKAPSDAPPRESIELRALVFHSA